MGLPVTCCRHKLKKPREYYVDIENASEHVIEQVKNTRTQVQSLLD